MLKYCPKPIALHGLMLAACSLLLAGRLGSGDPAGSTSSSTSSPTSSPTASSVLAPAAPSNLVATAGNAQVSLAWSASSTASSYDVKRSTISGGPYAQIASVTSPSYTDATVTNGTAYFYVVDAVYAAGDSADSATVAATPDPTITTPAVPLGLAATAGNAQVSLTWSASGTATSYHVKRATTSGGPYTQIAAPASSSYTDLSLTNGTTYYYVVSALDSAGESPNSAQASATPATPAGGTQGGPVGAITSITPSSGGVGAQIVIQGTNIGYATNGGIAAFSGGQQIAAILDGTWTVVNANEIIYTVPADGASGQFSFWNASGSGYFPFTFTFVPTKVPAAPPSLSQVSVNAEVDLTWTPVPNGASFNIWRSTTSGGGYTNIASVSNASTYSDLTVTNGVVYYYVVTAVDGIGNSAYSPQVTATPNAPAAGTATVTVTPGTTHSISPYIYGVNAAGTASFFPSGTSTSLPRQLTLDRVGGNRWTAYNWTTNASNAGSDYNYQNDGLLNTTPNSPAGPAKSQITFDQANGMASIITFPMQGLVAADEAGPVSTANPPQAGRFDSVQFAKGAPFVTGSNIPLNGTVYMDEYAYNVDALFAGEGIFTSTPTSYPVFGQLDNEPDLWNSTHLEVQGSTDITPAAFVTKTVALATALKNKYPKMTIFGAVNWGWSGVQSWQSAIPGTGNTGNNWFIDYFATALAAASASYGAPLVDVYDFHWYPQVVDPVSGLQMGYLNSSPLADSQTQLIAQWPRSLYDPTYVESSWIPGTIGGAAINALPRFKAKLAAANPGMKLAITEYFPGGGTTIAGTLAEADLLGAFGANGLFAATIWPLQFAPSVLGGFAAFRDFDGAGSNFGDISVAASSSNIANVSAYVSTDSAHPGRVVMVLINRSNSVQNATVSGETLSGTAHIYRMTQANVPTGTTPMTPASIGTQPASGSSITLALPGYSVTTVDIH